MPCIGTDLAPATVGLAGLAGIRPRLGLSGPKALAGRAFAQASVDRNTGRDETLHQVAIVGADICVIERYPQRQECAHQLAEIAKPAGVDTEDKLLIECL